MARTVSAFLAARRFAICCGTAAFMRVAGLGLLAAVPVHADNAGLPDPTRPPQAMLPQAEGARAAPEDGPRLQSVFISDKRRGAIISGEYVALGGRVGDARLTRVEPSGVVLRGPGGEVSLPLFPAVRREPVHSHPEASGKTSPPATGPRANPPVGQVPPRRQEKPQ